MDVPAVHANPGTAGTARGARTDRSNERLDAIRLTKGLCPEMETGLRAEAIRPVSRANLELQIYRRPLVDSGVLHFDVEFCRSIYDICLKRIAGEISRRRILGPNAKNIAVI